MSPAPSPESPPHPAGAAAPTDAAQLQAGGEEGFRHLFDALYAPLLGFARAVTRDAGAAEDLTQEAFVRLWDRRDALDGSTILRPYLFRVVRNLAFNLRRDSATRQRLLADPAHRDLTREVAPPPDAGLGEHELGDRLARMIDELPPRQREALTLTRVHGLSHDEVSVTMGCSPRTVNNHLVAALRTLRHRLAEAGALVASIASWIS